MSTNHTSNYKLSQWEPEDKVLRTDFNADNLAIDTALKNLDTGKASTSALNSLQSTVNAKASQSELNALKSQVSTLEGVALQAKFGSYKGDGKSGETNVKTLTFDRLPVLLIVRKQESYEGMIAPRGLTNTSITMNGHADSTAVWLTWDSGKKQVSWYGQSPWSHLNESGATYYYAAIF